jgi:MFS family permease
MALCHAHAIASVQIVNILVDPIKASLAISDTQYSLLQGAALGLLAVVLGVPIARIADTGHRRTVIALGAAAWSIGSLLSAASQNFTQLLGGRALVGIGEIVLFPAALSMIYDSAPRERLATAIGIFGSGGPIGSAIAFLGGGSLAASTLPAVGSAHLEGWRWAFILCGVSGLVIALIVLAVAEPERHVKVGADVHRASVVRYVRRAWPLYLSVSGGFILLSTAVLAVNAWAPTFLVRVHHLTYEAAGQLTGLAALACAAVGTWLAGASIDRFERSGRRDGAIVTSCIVAGMLALTTCACVFSPSVGWVAVSLCLTYFLLGMPTVLGGTALQQISPSHIRAQVLAIHVLLINLIAQPIGPTSVALITDRAFGIPSAVGQSLAIVVSVITLAAIGVFLLGQRAFIAHRAIVLALIRPGHQQINEK